MGRSVLRFDSDLEQAFQADCAQNRRSQLIYCSVCLVLLCLAALPLDFLEHDRPWLAVALRLGFLLPIQIAGLLALRWSRSSLVESLAVLVPVTTATWTVGLIGYLTQVNSPDVANRYYLAAGAIAFTFNFVMPLRFKHAAWTTLAVLLVYNTQIVLAARLNVEMQPTAVFVTIITLFSLYTRWRLEKAERSEFISRNTQAQLNHELQALTKHLAILATTDPLTGLPNRRQLQDVLDKYWSHAERNGEWIGAAIADIDHFKLVNDAVGHLEGDVCLKSMADRLENVAVRAGGSVARFGGEEFVVLAPGTDPDAILRMGEEMRSEINRVPILHPGLPDGAHVTISVGVSSTIPSARVGSVDLLRAADTALYEAKARGRNTVVGRETTPRQQVSQAKHAEPKTATS